MIWSSSVPILRLSYFIPVQSLALVSMNIIPWSLAKVSPSSLLTLDYRLRSDLLAIRILRRLPPRSYLGSSLSRSFLAQSKDDESMIEYTTVIPIMPLHTIYLTFWLSDLAVTSISQSWAFIFFWASVQFFTKKSTPTVYLQTALKSSQHNRDKMLVFPDCLAPKLTNLTMQSHFSEGGKIINYMNRLTSNCQRHCFRWSFIFCTLQILENSLLELYIRANILILNKIKMPLTKERAEFRSAHIKKGTIFYDFHVSVQAGTHYSGVAQLTFELASIPHELPIDFQIQEIKKIVVNGQVSQQKSEEGFILIEGQKLKEGKNEIAVWYRNKYNNDGSGCVSFIDVDSKQYLYTQFEPYYANRVFPLFDQPDLKAKMRLSVLCPKDWKKVISNEHATVDMKGFSNEEYFSHVKTSHKELVSEFTKDFDGNMTIFPETKLLPCYLFAFVAGAYVELKLQQTYKNIPMSLYCIESLYKHMEELAPFMFEITIESMKFFESFFGYEFAFSKYDQIFAHEYKWGAMENAGCVTFNDIYIWKEKVSTEKMLALANTVSHELAHHWFGNLVTMKWWDDLWLNESFADFISHFCLEKIKHNCKTISYESSMASFLNRKAWGYQEDQMVTTHPIRGEVPNTTVADSIFDGITYSKGAATMKQLLYLMKEQNFSQALSVYFHKYEFNNATLSDFIDEMQKKFEVKEFTLAEWRTLWLEKASLNQIQPQWNCHDHSADAKIKIKMTPYTPEHPTLRPHKIKIALFKEDLSHDEIETLLYPQEVNEVAYDGSKNYRAVLLNYEDHTFAKNNIDQTSRQFFADNLDKIQDVLSRTLVWRSFFDMVKDAKITSRDYLGFVVKNIGQEKSDSIFERQFDLIHAAITTYTPIPFREELGDIAFNLLLDLLKATPADNKNRIVILKSKLTSFAFSEANRKILLDWRQGKFELLKEHPMTIVQEWSAVVSAFTLKDLSLEQKQALFASQKQKDSSDTAKLKRYTCDALKASKEEFLKIYEEFKSAQKCNEWSISVKGAINAGWRSKVHIDQLVELKKRFFSEIPEVAKNLQGDHLQFFVDDLEPIDDDLEGTIQGYQSFKLVGEKFDKINRNILKIIDQLKRRGRAYALFLEKSKL